MALVCVFLGAYFSFFSRVDAVSVSPCLFKRLLLFPLLCLTCSFSVRESFHLLHAMAVPVIAGFDLNVRLEEDEDGNVPFHLNEPILEDHNVNGNVFVLSFFFLYSQQQHQLSFYSKFFLSFFRQDLI